MLLQLNDEQQRNAQGYMQYLLQQAGTTELFKLPWKVEESAWRLTGAYMAEVYMRQRPFVDDIYTSSHIAKAAEWLTLPSPKFGLLLCGRNGNGKTTLAKAIQRVISDIYGSFKSDTKYLRFVTSKEVCDIAKKKDDKKSFYDLCNEELLYIDDLGVEPAEDMNYGSIVTPVIDLLLVRYEKRLFTIVSTNLEASQIRPQYGDRVADRLNEMFDRIVFDNESYRK